MPARDAMPQDIDRIASVNFDFSDEQNMLRDQARRYLGEASSKENVRKWLDSKTTATATLWQALAEMGWLGAAIDEDHGGLGLGGLELCVLAEELGRALTPVPFFSTVCVAAELLQRCPAAPRRDGLLGAIAAGTAIVSLTNGLEQAIATGHGLPQWSDGVVSGVCERVPDLMEATALLTIAREPDGTLVVLAVAADAAGVGRQALAGFDDLRPHGRLTLASAAAEVLLRGTEAASLLEKIRDRAAIYTAFEQVGTAESAMSLAREYTLQRYAFGRPLAGNQAVKHRLADMLVKNELARSNAYYGAWALVNDESALPQAAAAARLSATEALIFAAEEGLHLHGGIGYTWEADCHLYLRRARLLAVSLGGAAAWSRRLLAAHRSIAH